MKSKNFAALTMIIGVALSTTAFAQGRHDEKPHAQGKPAALSTDKERAIPRAGRHDDRPHGLKAPARNADDAEKIGK